MPLGLIICNITGQFLGHLKCEDLFPLSVKEENLGMLKYLCTLYTFGLWEGMVLKNNFVFGSGKPNKKDLIKSTRIKTTHQKTTKPITFIPRSASKGKVLGSIGMKTSTREWRDLSDIYRYLPLS